MFLKNKIGYLTIISGLILFLAACAEKYKTGEPVRIAVSKAVHYDSSNGYYNWLLSIDSTLVLEEMYHRSLDSAAIIIEQCDGLLLTGGTDIYPGRYGKEGDTARCWEPNFKRDTLEAMLIQKAIENNIPILGICRGSQNLNVYFGGTLYIDIPTDFDSLINHRNPGSYDCFHNLMIVENSLLAEISGKLEAEVNSAHHQAVEDIADNLEPIAFAEDGLIEAITYKNQEGKPFLLGVQWHPEQLSYNHPLSGPIGQHFVKAIKQTKQLNINNSK